MESATTTTKRPSEEQCAIINAVIAGRNVIVNALPGSGKTSTVLFLAHACRSLRPRRNILLIAYNRALKEEVQVKVTNEGLDQCISTFTYHGLARITYECEVSRDAHMENIINKDKAPRNKRKVDHVIVIDEAQDMKELYFRFVKKYMRDTVKRVKPVIVVLGDPMQCVYRFRGSDHRFLTLFDRLLVAPHATPDTFVQLPLHVSYRLTQNTAAFVNQFIIGQSNGTQIRTHDNAIIGATVKYVSCDVFTQTVADHGTIADLITELRRSLKAEYSDIYVLAPSLSFDYVKRIANNISERGCPVDYPSDNTISTEDDRKNKIAFSTFHQSKGCERPYCFVLAFDESYYRRMVSAESISSAADMRNDDVMTTCPDPIYVAVTRAIKCLYVFHHNEFRPLPFLHGTLRDIEDAECVDYLGSAMVPSIDLVEWGITDSNKAHDNDLLRSRIPTIIHVSRMARNVNACETELFAICDQLFETHTRPWQRIDLDYRVQTTFGDDDTELSEYVADITGIAIPAYYEKYVCRNHDQRSVAICIDDLARAAIERSKSLAFKYRDAMQLIGCDRLQRVLLDTLMGTFITNGVIARIMQINRYDWITYEQAYACIESFRREIPPDRVISGHVTFEEPLIAREDRKTLLHSYQTSTGDVVDIRVAAVVDAISTECIWELKCTAKLELEHKLQLVIYAYLWITNFERTNGMRRFKLINMRTGEILELKTDHESRALISRVFSVLIENELREPVVLDDDEFIERVRALS